MRPRYTASDLAAIASGLLTQAGLPLERTLKLRAEYLADGVVL